jgi:cytoskeletal protein RodZ
MRQVLALVAFMLATMVWTMAQQPGASGGQSTSPNSQTPTASQSQPSQSQPSQSQPSARDSAGQGSAQSQGSSQSPQSQSPAQSQDPASRGSAQSGAGSQGQVANAPITEGCLGGSNPNFTITDKAGTTYKLNIPQGADTSVLTPHVGESVQVMGQITNGGGAGKASSIDVSKIGRGQGGCPADKSKQPKQ